MTDLCALFRAPLSVNCGMRVENCPHRQAHVV